MSLNLYEALQKCKETAESIKGQLVQPRRDEKRLHEAADLIGRKDDSVYGRYLRQVERIGDTRLVLLVALALGKSALHNMRNEVKTQLPRELKKCGYTSPALSGLVRQYCGPSSPSSSVHQEASPSEREGSPQVGTGLPQARPQGQAQAPAEIDPSTSALQLPEISEEAPTQKGTVIISRPQASKCFKDSRDES